MEIKKTPKGFEVDGITFDSHDVAERYVESIRTQEKAEADWLDERIDYKFDPIEKNSSTLATLDNFAKACPEYIQVIQSASKGETSVLAWLLWD